MEKGSVRINPCLVLLNIVFGCAGLGFVGVGIWMARHHSTNCIHFFQAFSVGIGLFMVAVALAGLVGSFCRVTWLLYINFGIMLLLLMAILATTVFVLVVTSHGIKAYVSESQKDALSQWLLQQVNNRVESCTQNGDICRLIDNTYSQSSSYYRPSLSSLQVGCCEPPKGCDNVNATAIALASDCAIWKQVGPQGFCSQCKSCHAAVAENVRHVWHQVAIFKIIILLILIPMYFLTCCSFKREERHSHDRSFHEGLNCCYSCL
ncbi:hypothetical protein GOP47_0001519 [Adiantum capillus-veneris]|uniref:Uncharacterized protein n=1 Tax=Adiantum capillus-veneris TaxID=13818 RepID=A0A9D4ZQ46_ADICA|nr:hypothetical protein GOP47_0001519 [Adiantum capillus-veneris]